MTYPNKPALNNYPIHELIRNRWSPSVFSDKFIEEEKIMSLFEAGRWAPSSYNEQPWRFVYATRADAENFDRLASLLMPGNQWANKAALLIVVFAKKNFQHNNKPNHNAMYDAGAAAENLFLEAFHLGLMAHEMIGFDLEKAGADLGFAAAEYWPSAMMAVGYPAGAADLEKIDPLLKKRELAERKRMDLEQIIFKGKRA